MTGRTRERRPPAGGKPAAPPPPRAPAAADPRPERARPGLPPGREIGGPEGPEPTRYGDWEKGGRCTDF